MTIALAIETPQGRTLVALSLRYFDIDLWATFALLLMPILAGLLLDLRAGLPVGTFTLWPAVLAAVAVIGLLVKEWINAAGGA